MKPLALHHVQVNVTDVPAALEFYTDVLGLTVRDDRPDFGFAGAWLDAGEQQVHLVEAAVPPRLGQHFAVLVDDLDATVDELTARGIEVSRPMAVGPDRRQAFLSDPAGNGIELHQYRPTGSA